MEIGGYMELEHFASHPYHTNVYELNLGRTALLALLSSLSCRHLMIPYMICDSLTDILDIYNIQTTYYQVDEKLLPILPRPLEQNEYLLLINYYGQLSDERIRACKNIYQRIIVDHTHSFFQKPLPGIPTFYSIRKFFGVSDGAYLSFDGSFIPPRERDSSHDRMSHLLGRYEEDASAWYSHMLANASAFHQESIKAMSPLTRNILGAIDYQAVAARREANYSHLAKRLPQKNLANGILAKGPLCYPYHVKNGREIRSLLAKEKIYVPVYWNKVIAAMAKDSLEYDLAANILPLPCDQRYSIKEMDIIADTLLQLIER